jgi:hypothetical protein
VVLVLKQILILAVLIASFFSFSAYSSDDKSPAKSDIKTVHIIDPNNPDEPAIVMGVEDGFWYEFAGGALENLFGMTKESGSFVLDMTVMSSFVVEQAWVQVGAFVNYYDRQTQSGMNEYLFYRRQAYDPASLAVQSILDKGLVNTAKQMPRDMYESTFGNLSRCFRKDGKACGAGVTNIVLLLIPIKVLRTKYKAHMAVGKTLVKPVILPPVHP